MKSGIKLRGKRSFNYRTATSSSSLKAHALKSTFIVLHFFSGRHSTDISRIVSNPAQSHTCHIHFHLQRFFLAFSSVRLMSWPLVTKVYSEKRLQRLVAKA